MNFNDSILLQSYADAANKQFGDTQSRLDKIESGIQTRMDGKTVGSLAGSLVGTLAWAVAFGCFFWCLKGKVDDALLIIAALSTVGLILFMLIDNIVSFNYYGNISSYNDNVKLLKNRVSTGRSSVRSKLDVYMESRKKGWKYKIESSSSIPAEASSIETTMSSMESLKGGFLNSVKNFFYYTVVVMIMIVGSVAMFGYAGEIMTGISGESISADTLMTLNVIGLIIAGIGEVIVAKLAWSKSDCEVTNTTLFVTALGPVAFIILMLVATLLVMLVIGLVSVVLALLAAAAAFGILTACISGG